MGWKIIRVKGNTSYTILEGLATERDAQDALDRYMPMMEGVDGEYVILPQETGLSELKKRPPEREGELPITMDDGIEFVSFGEVDEGKTHD